MMQCRCRCRYRRRCRYRNLDVQGKGDSFTDSDSDSDFGLGLGEQGERRCEGMTYSLLFLYFTLRLLLSLLRQRDRVHFRSVRLCGAVGTGGTMQRRMTVRYRSTLALSSDVNYGVVWYAWAHGACYAYRVCKVSVFPSSFFLFLVFRFQGAWCVMLCAVRECFWSICI